MCKKIILFFFIFHLTPAFSQEQSIKIQLISSEKIDLDQFKGIDGMGNSYYIKNNVFFKKNKTEVWSYKNISLGKITKIDIQNELKIMLFYENFNTIILLDNQLNETQKINFSENEIPLLVTAAGIAAQNRVWIYNTLTQEIGLFDYLKNNFQSITPPFEGTLKYYESDFNNFWWIDDKFNWYSCDVFGKILFLGKVADFEQIQFVSNQITLFSKGGKLYLQKWSDSSIYPIENVDKTFKNFYYKDQILSIFTNQEIINYKITTP